MLDGRVRMTLELMGFTIIGNVVPYFHVYCFRVNDYKKEVEDNMELIDLEIKHIILDDLLEAIENDFSEGNNCNPEKWVKEMFKEGLL